MSICKVFDNLDLEIYKFGNYDFKKKLAYKFFFKRLVDDDLKLIDILYREEFNYRNKEKIKLQRFNLEAYFAFSKEFLKKYNNNDSKNIKTKKNLNLDEGDVKRKVKNINFSF